MPAVYKVHYDIVWDKDRKSVEGCFNSWDKTVAAKDAVDAIRKTRKSEVGRKFPVEDEDGNEIPKKFTIITEIVIGGVDYVSDIEVL